MPASIFDAFRDFSQYARTFYGWRTIRRPGMGVDFRADEYREQAKRMVEALHPARMRLRVIRVIQEAPSTKTFRLVRVDGPLPPFRAGQYINLYVDFQGVLTSRPFSISSPPGRDYLDLTARGLKRGFVSPYLAANIHVGDSLDASGPAGSFYHEPLIDGDDLVFLAGGSGITPFMSMIREQAEKGWPLQIALLYGSRDPHDVIFADELAELAKTTPRFRYCLQISDPPKNWRGPKGFLDAALLRNEIGAPDGKTFYLCGPNAMYDFCLPELAKFGAPRHKIKRELYGPPADVARHVGWPAHLSPTAEFQVRVGDRVIPAIAGEPLINSLERHGIVVPAVCRSGECSACRTKLIEGRVYMPPTAGVREADRQFGYIHACVAFPLTDLVVAV
jgi:ferredoxin-NADP reductase